MASYFDLTQANEWPIEQGATFQMDVTWKATDGTPVDLTGSTARMQLRETYDSGSTLVSLTSGSGITLGGTAGTVTIVITAAQTAALPIVAGVYDLEVESGTGVVTRLLQGVFEVTPEVTR